jgi:hypothetical protein
VLEALVKDGGGGYDRPGEGATTGFVNSTYEQYELPLGAQFLLRGTLG